MKNSQLLNQLREKVEVEYSSRPKPKAKNLGTILETEYCVGDSVFFTLAAAQKHAVATNTYKIGRVLGETIVRWYGSINYKLGTIEWVKREEKI